VIVIRFEYDPATTGVMPEVKRREIQRRRNQREKLWRDDDDEDDGGEDGPSGVGGGGALKRAAKKILVKQLKEWREKEAMMQKKKSQRKKENGKSGEGDASMDDGEMLGGEFNVGTSKTPSNSGALAAGFTLEDGEDITSRSQQPLMPQMRHDNTSDDVITIDGSRGVDHKQSEVDRTQGGDEDDNDQDYDSENDWETSHAIQSSINAFPTGTIQIMRIHTQNDTIISDTMPTMRSLPRCPVRRDISGSTHSSGRIAYKAVRSVYRRLPTRRTIRRRNCAIS